MTHDEIRGGLSAPHALIATLYGEARAEPIVGIIGCACVIRNRAKHPRWWGDSIRTVCLKPAQFSCWWENNANTRAVYALAEGLIIGQPLGTGTVLSELAWIAHGVIEGQLRDLTHGADHYLTRALFEGPKCPSWARHQTPVAELGAHVFLRLET